MCGGSRNWSAARWHCCRQVRNGRTQSSCVIRLKRNKMTLLGRGRRGEPMADYYPLIVKAISGLEKSTGEARRALYDRARTALLAQLRGVEPALSEPEITRERLALEEAIRKVEAEAARRSRNDPLPVRPDFRQEPSQETRPEGRLGEMPTEVAGPSSRHSLRTSRPTIVRTADDGDDRSDKEETR